MNLSGQPREDSGSVMKSRKTRRKGLFIIDWNSEFRKKWISRWDIRVESRPIVLCDYWNQNLAVLLSDIAIKRNSKEIIEIYRFRAIRSSLTPSKLTTHHTRMALKAWVDKSLRLAKVLNMAWWLSKPASRNRITLSLSAGFPPHFIANG